MVSMDYGIEENLSSGRVLEKLGFRFIREESYVCNG